jgi:hypothetical protein
VSHVRPPYLLVVLVILIVIEAYAMTSALGRAHVILWEGLLPRLIGVLVAASGECRGIKPLPQIPAGLHSLTFWRRLEGGGAFESETQK